MATGNSSGRDVEYEVQPPDPGGNLTTDESLWTLVLRFLGLA